MSNNLQFSKIEVDIAGLLNSAAMVGMYRGKEVWGEVEKEMNEVLDYSMVMIDIRGANPLQYEFCQYAFGPLFNELNRGAWPHKYVIFKMYDFHKPGFFRGVLKDLGTELPRRESEDGFVSAGFYAKLIVGDIDNIIFVGKENLNEAQSRTLDVLNDMKDATARQVVEKLNSPEEVIVDSLRFLVEKKFVVGPYDQGNGTPHYYSLYKYL